MSDTANQVGKVIKSNNRAAQRVLKRYVPKLRKVERILDTFDSAVPFTMEFHTKDTESRFTLDIIFRKPGPSTCCDQFICAICESAVVADSDPITFAPTVNSPTTIITSIATPTPVNSPLPVGGDESLRGPKSFTVLTTSHFASGNTASFNAARDAAGPGGVVRIVGDIVGNLACNVVNQTIQIESTSISVTGQINFEASGVTWEGGTINGGFYAPRSPLANNITIKNFIGTSWAFGGHFIALEGGHDNWLISQFSITNPQDNFIRAWYDQSGDNDPDGMRIEHGIMVRNAAWGTRASHGFSSNGPSAVSGADGNNLNVQRNFVMHNCRIDNGSSTQGGMGVEWWGHESSGTSSGKGGIIEYCDLRGGFDFLISNVRSRDNWTHHNQFTLGPAYATYESAGPNHLRGLYEWNLVHSTAANTRAAIYHNNSATLMEIRNNTFDNVKWIIDGCCNGGGYDIHDNCRTGSYSEVVSGTGFSIANTDINNISGCDSVSLPPPPVDDPPLPPPIDPGTIGGGSGGSSGGFFPVVDSPQINLSHGYLPNSTTVYVSGKLRTEDYTETNPAAGIVTINKQVIAGTIVRVCYVYLQDVSDNPFG